MTGGEIAQIITSIGTLIAALGSLVISLRNGVKIEQVHQTTNSKMDKLIEVSIKSARAEGREEQRLEQGNHNGA
jgi:uncharacterized membrane protein